MDGTEIYVGDIFTYSMEGIPQNSPLVVKDLHSFWAMLDNPDSYLRIDSSSIKVIGNIHKSLGLLEKG